MIRGSDCRWWEERRTKKDIWGLSTPLSSKNFQAVLLPWRLHRSQLAGRNHKLSASLLLQHEWNTKQRIRQGREWLRNRFFLSLKVSSIKSRAPNALAKKLVESVSSNPLEIITTHCQQLKAEPCGVQSLKLICKQFQDWLATNDKRG